MNLELNFPVLARMSCEECQTYLIDYDWTKHRGSGDRMKRHDGDWKRNGGPPPCKENPNRVPPLCPKESPEKETEHVLSQKNRQTVAFYWQVRATCGACLTGPLATDATLLENLATIDLAVRASEKQDMISGVAMGVAGMMMR